MNAPSWSPLTNSDPPVCVGTVFAVIVGTGVSVGPVAVVAPRSCTMSRTSAIVIASALTKVTARTTTDVDQF